jgi:outer membrane protein assembly factor BamB
MLRWLALAVVLVSTPVRADDWPQWRGPKRDGVAPNARMPANWPQNPPKPLWKVPIGEGQSSPVVAGGRVFVMSRDKAGKEICWCLNATTGKEVWKHSYPAPFKPADLRSGLGPKSTPTVDGNRAYFLGAAGKFTCLQIAPRKMLWQHDFLKEFWGVEKDKDGDDAYSTCCGAATSPLIDGARVVLPVGGKKAGAMAAFDKVKGTVVWRSKIKDRSSYASPLIASLGGVKQVVGFTGLRFVGLNADGGDLLWDRPFPAQFEQTVLTPVVWKDLVIFGGEDRPTLAMRVSQADGKPVAKLAWENPQLKAYMTSPVAFKGHLAGLTRLGRLVCLDLATGKTTWQGGSFGTYGSLVVAGDNLLVLDSKGELHVFAANPKKMERRARWELTENTPVWGHLAVSGGRLYVRDNTDLMCFEMGK